MSKYSNRSNRCHRERNTSRGNKGTFISCKVGGGRRWEVDTSEDAPVVPAFIAENVRRNEELIERGVLQRGPRRPLSPLARLRSGAGWPGAGFAAKGRRSADDDEWRMTKIADWVGTRAEELLQSMKRESYDLRHQERELEAAWDNWDWDTLESYGLITKADYQFVQKFLGEYGDTGWETRGSSARGRRARGRRADRPLHQIAREIRRDWGSKVNYAAVPYLDAMGSLSSIDDNYGYDSGSSIVMYFLSNARSWRGPKAKEIKAELKGMLK